MYYVSWNKYLNRSSSDLEFKPSKPLNISSELPSRATTANPFETSSSATISPTSPTLPTEIPDPAFPLFAQLPTELRLKIWEHYHVATPPQPLTFRLCPADIDYIPHKRKTCFAHPHVLALRQQSIPTILHTCSESREVGLAHYKLGFDVASDECRSSCSHEHQDLKGKNTLKEVSERTEIYWDPSKDIVHLELGWASSTSTVYTWGSTIDSTTSATSSNLCFKDIKCLALNSRTWFQLADTRMGATSFNSLEGVFMIGKWGEISDRTSEHRVIGVVGRGKVWDKVLRVWERKIKSWCARVGTEAEVVEVKLIENLGDILDGLEH